MSTPQNILNKYRSYSYHHILIACDNDAAAQYVRRSNAHSAFREFSARAVLIDDESQRIRDVDINDEATGKPDQTRVGSYVVILNGMIDTSYVIRDVSWFSTTAASTVQNDKFTSIAVEGTMTIEEPRGVNFLNALNSACDILRSDPTGVIWLLKTIFVGHRDTLGGDRESDYIMDLLPLEFMMYNVTGTFDNSGGVYEIAFAGLSNGAARFPQFSQVAQTINVSVKETLKDTFAVFEQRMNGNSRKNRICVIKKLKEVYAEFTDVDLEEFREVQYAIIPEDPYNDPDYIVDGLNDQEKELALAHFRQGVLKFLPKATVEGAIRHIMDRCTKVQKDRTQGDPIPNISAGQKYSWKIHSEISMVGKNTINPIGKKTSKKDIIAVIYRIRRHAELTNKTIEDVLRGTDSDPSKANDTITKQRIKDNLITFDFFFTGKNIDIINFDLKMDMGLAFLQTISSTNTIGSGTSQLSGTVYKESNATVIVGTENNRANIIARSRTPIFPATNINNVFQKNVPGAADSTQYHAMLSRHAALESVEAVATIHGNPYLMSQTNRKPSDTQRKENTGDDEGDFSRIMQNHEFMPALAKVNIYMPLTSDTPSSISTFQRTKFWYDGFYYIYGIDHKFSDGQFTQDLHLLSLPQESLLLNKQKTDISACGDEEPKKEEDDSTAGGADEGKTEVNTKKANTNVYTTYDDNGNPIRIRN